MPAGFFDLADSSRMYGKVVREFEKLTRDFSSDNLFNFFVTAYHVNDYLKAENDPRASLLRNSASFEWCRIVCNTAKHFRVNIDYRVNNHLKKTPETVKYDGGLGGAPLGIMVLSGGDEYIIDIDGKQVCLRKLSSEVMYQLAGIFDDAPL